MSEARAPGVTDAEVKAALAATYDELPESVQYVLIRGLSAMGWALPANGSWDVMRTALTAALAHPPAAERDASFAEARPRTPTETMMDAGLYHASADTTWADIHTIWTSMWDTYGRDGAEREAPGGVEVSSGCVFRDLNASQPSDRDVQAKAREMYETQAGSLISHPSPWDHLSFDIKKGWRQVARKRLLTAAPPPPANIGGDSPSACGLIAEIEDLRRAWSDPKNSCQATPAEGAKP